MSVRKSSSLCNHRYFDRSGRRVDSEDTVDTGSSPDCPSAHSNTQQITDPNEYSCARLWQRPDCAGLEKTLPQSSEDAFVSSFKKDAPYRQKQTLRKESINPSC